MGKKAETPTITQVMSKMMGAHKPPGTKKRTNKYNSLICFTFREMQLYLFLVLFSLPTNINTLPTNLGNIPAHSNDPYSDQSSQLSSDQFSSNLFCSCSCYLKNVTREHTIN